MLASFEPLSAQLGPLPARVVPTSAICVPRSRPSLGRCRPRSLGPSLGRGRPTSADFEQLWGLDQLRADIDLIWIELTRRGPRSMILGPILTPNSTKYGWPRAVPTTTSSGPKSSTFTEFNLFVTISMNLGRTQASLHHGCAYSRDISYFGKLRDCHASSGKVSSFVPKSFVLSRRKRRQERLSTGLSFGLLAGGRRDPTLELSLT